MSFECKTNSKISAQANFLKCLYLNRFRSRTFCLKHGNASSEKVFVNLNLFKAQTQKKHSCTVHTHTNKHTQFCAYPELALFNNTQNVKSTDFLSF